MIIPLCSLPENLRDSIIESLEGIYDSYSSFAIFPTNITQKDLAEFMSDNQAKAYIRVINYLEDTYGLKNHPYFIFKT